MHTEAFQGGFPNTSEAVTLTQIQHYGGHQAKKLLFFWDSIALPALFPKESFYLDTTQISPPGSLLLPSQLSALSLWILGVELSPRVLLPGRITGSHAKRQRCLLLPWAWHDCQCQLWPGRAPQQWPCVMGAPAGKARPAGQRCSWKLVGSPTPNSLRLKSATWV